MLTAEGDALITWGPVSSTWEHSAWTALSPWELVLVAWELPACRGGSFISLGNSADCLGRGAGCTLPAVYKLSLMFCRKS